MRILKTLPHFLLNIKAEDLLIILQFITNTNVFTRMSMKTKNEITFWYYLAVFTEINFKVLHLYIS